jgi:PPM family protein phosphatase
MDLTVAARTDVGMIRSGNEDAFFANATPQLGLFIVADGMGGHAAGEVASEMAVQIVSRELSDVADLHGEEIRERVALALRTANRAIFERTLAESDKQGMGTTASVLMLSGKRYLIGQVGDSRVYMLREGALRQLTKDHSYVQEQVDAGLLTPEQARYHPYSNVITRCVGAGESIDPDTFTGEVKQGDVDGGRPAAAAAAAVARDAAPCGGCAHRRGELPRRAGQHHGHRGAGAAGGQRQRRRSAHGGGAGAEERRA